MAGHKTDKTKKKETPKGNLPGKEEMSQKSGEQNCQEALLSRMFSAMDVLENKMLAAISSSQQTVVTKLADFERTLNFYGNKIDDISRIVEIVQQKLALMEKRMEKTENENKDLKAKLQGMEIQLNEVEQNQCNDKIEITGNVTKNTDPIVLTEEILVKAGLPPSQVEFRAKKVVKTYKDGEKVQEKASVIVQFRSTDDRNDVMSKIKQEKVFNRLENGRAPIYINELLSPYYKKLLFELNTLKRQGSYSYVWVKEGKILVKKTQESKVCRITSMNDLAKISA